LLSTIERREQIVERVNAEGRVDVPQLAGEYGVSTVTIRADLNELDRGGLVVRCRGGAIPASEIARELSVQERYKKHQPVKRRLGEAVAGMLLPGQSVILDAGTTTEEVARCLVGHSELAVMTNGLNIASALASAEDVEVRITGGVLRRDSMSFYGGQAEQSLSQMYFHTLILGVDGFNLQAGITTYFEPEAHLNRLMCRVSERVIAVTDSSKFGLSAAHVICQCHDLDVLVTDRGLPGEYQKALADAGVELVLVDN